MLGVMSSGPNAPLDNLSTHPRPMLSVVVPMFREAARIGRTLDDLIPALARGDRPSEVILVDDGSDDATAEAVAPKLRESVDGSLLRVRLLRHELNRGKGAAVRTGLAAASGWWRLIMDADNSTRIGEVEKLFEAAGRTGAGLVAGSRAAPGCVVSTRAHRKATGLIFRAALYAMGMRLLADTQCGFKLYRADAAELVARHGREDRFAFDLEHLKLVASAGVRIEEVGVVWEHADAGTVRPIRDGLQMLRRAWALRAAHAPADALDAARGTRALEMLAVEVEVKPLAAEPVA